MRTANGSSHSAPETRFLSLTLGLILGPIAALTNQATIYVVNMWACGRDAHQGMHMIPVLSLVVVVIAALLAERNRRIPREGQEVNDSAPGRTHFLALLGLSISLLSAIVIIAQWASIISFDPCMR